MSTQTSDNNIRLERGLYFRMLILMLYRCLWGDVYSKDVEITENIMSEEQYNELLKAYTKEALASMIKADIRTRFPEPYASMYCQQFDNFKNVADFFEFAAKLMRK